LTNCIRTLLLFVIVLSCGVSLSAQAYDSITVLLNHRKFAEAETLLVRRLKANPEDDSAHYYLGQIPVRSDAVNRYDEAIEHFKKCVELKPNSSTYQLWLGRAYGVKAQDAGVFSAVGYIGDIKTAFRKAVELDSGNFDARYDLIQFYLQSPGIFGGSVSKAKAVAESYAGLNPDGAPILRAAVDIYEKEFDNALEKILAMPKPADSIILGYYRSTITNIGFALLNDKQPQKAEGIFAKFTAEFPALAVGYHGLGRSNLDQGKVDEAIAFFGKALQIDSTVGSQYRLGVAYEKKGEREKAMKCYEEFLALTTPRDKKAVDDAKDRLEELKKKPN
jgi:tetratricopeptide (TPR) repeat protein